MCEVQCSAQTRCVSGRCAWHCSCQRYDVIASVNTRTSTSAQLQSDLRLARVMFVFSLCSFCECVAVCRELHRGLCTLALHPPPPPPSWPRHPIHPTIPLRRQPLPCFYKYRFTWRHSNFFRVFLLLFSVSCFDGFCSSDTTKSQCPPFHSASTLKPLLKTNGTCVLCCFYAKLTKEATKLPPLM